MVFAEDFFFFLWVVSDLSSYKRLLMVLSLIPLPFSLLPLTPPPPFSLLLLLFLSLSFSFTYSLFLYICMSDYIHTLMGMGNRPLFSFGITIIKVIRRCFGDGVARELMSLSLAVTVEGHGPQEKDEDGGGGGGGGEEEEEEGEAVEEKMKVGEEEGEGESEVQRYERTGFNVKVTGLVSNANWSQLRSQFIIFINHRLVDCRPLKRAVEGEILKEKKKKKKKKKRERQRQRQRG